MKRIFTIIIRVKLLLLIFSPSHAQNSLHVVGKIFNEKGPLSHATIEIEKDSVVVGNYISNNQGKFSFNLEFDNLYVLNFKSDGYSTKKVEVNTFLPEAKDPLQHQLVSLQLELLRQYSGQIESKILGEIKFSRITKEFAYESKYDVNTFLNVQVTGIDYYLSKREKELIKEGEVELLELDIQEEDVQKRKESFYEYIISEREEFLEEKADSINFKEIPVKDKKFALDTTINKYTHHRMKVVEVIINNEDILRVYHKVNHYWGAIFYFKNYRPISRPLFYLETPLN
jgi:hypothetical protein